MALGPVKPHTREVAKEITAHFGITNIGGFATTGHVANSDHYLGLALDVMITSRSQGDAVAAWAQQNAERLGVTYIIWQRHIWNIARAGEGWRKYVGPNPHTNHVHISLKEAGGNPDAPNADPVGLPNPLGDVGKVLGMYGNLIGWYANPHNWIRVIMVAGGVIFILIAIFSIDKVQHVAATATTATVKGVKG